MLSSCEPQQKYGRAWLSTNNWGVRSPFAVIFYHMQTNSVADLRPEGQLEQNMDNLIINIAANRFE